MVSFLEATLEMAYGPKAYLSGHKTSQSLASSNTWLLKRTQAEASSSLFLTWSSLWNALCDTFVYHQNIESTINV